MSNEPNEETKKAIESGHQEGDKTFDNVEDLLDDLGLSDTNLDELKHFLATEVMQLELREAHPEIEGSAAYYLVKNNNGDNDFYCLVKDYIPNTDMNQMMDCVQKWLECGQSSFDLDMWRNGEGGEMVCLCLLGIATNHPDQIFKGQADTAPLAIGKALAKAKGKDFSK